MTSERNARRFSGGKRVVAAISVAAALSCAGCGGDNGDVVVLPDDLASTEIAEIPESVPSAPQAQTPDSTQIPETAPSAPQAQTPDSTQIPETVPSAPQARTVDAKPTPTTFDALVAAGMKVGGEGKTVDLTAVERFDGFAESDAAAWKSVKVVRGAGALTANAVRSFAKLPNLTEFLWSDARLANADAEKAFDNLLGAKSLKKVRLTGLTAADGGAFPVGVLAALAKVPNLADVDVSGSPLGADDLSKIDLKTGFPKLTKLNLYRTNVGNAGVAALLSLADRLVSLNLDDAKIGPEAADNLVKFSNLTFLHVGRSNLDDAAVAKLGALSKLEKIHITRSNATETGADALRAALPKCEVVSQPEN